METNWLPRLDTNGETLHERILDALRQDIGAGALAPGARMPTQRDLAHRLGIGVGTVTRAYAEAERMGLLTGRVGRGTFVAGGHATAGARADQPLDLTMNLPPFGPAAARFADVLSRLRRRPDIGTYVSLAPHAGFDEHRQAAATWLARAARFESVDWRRLLICNGSQQALALALDVACRRGDTVLVETATFFGMKSLAELRGLSLVGVAMDGEGILPEALDRAAAESGARLLYVQPTLQNPTARSMSRRRRDDIVAIARRRDLSILECGIYAPLALGGANLDARAAEMLPLALLAPERTYYTSSVSKALAPGLRTGFLVTPDAARFDKSCAAMRATAYSVSALGPLIATQWINDGTADEILAEVGREAANRTALAARILGQAIEAPSFAQSLHVWLPFSELEAERIAGRALRHGVALTPPSAMLVAGAAGAGLRLCLSTPPDLPTLDRALRVMAAAIAGDTEGRSVI
ncbi:MAG: PLP-dependent aminotransferase family protein [Alphaproteobacteria bacterium]